MTLDQHGSGYRQLTVKTAVDMRILIRHYHPRFSILGCTRLYTTAQETYQVASQERMFASLNHSTVSRMTMDMSVLMFVLSRFQLFLLITMWDSKLLRLTVLLA